MKVSCVDSFKVDLPAEHRFPMLKYELIREQLLYEGIFRSSQFFVPDLIPEEYILAAHTVEYWEKVKHLGLSAAEERRLGFPQSKSLIRRCHASASGTLMSACFALQEGAGLNLAGGTHHAYPDRGEGFCVLNDVAITTHYLLKEQKVQRVLIVDLDVHQGNGTAVFFANQPEVFTLSVHCAANYPLKKEKSDLDYHLPAGTDDVSYLNLIAQIIPTVLDQTQPNIVFYIAGVDVLATDKLGKFALTRNGCFERDKIVLYEVHKRAIPIVIVMGGGYSERMTDIIAAHCNTFRLLADLYN